MVNVIGNKDEPFSRSGKVIIITGYHNYSAFRLNVEEPVPKLSQQPIRAKENVTRSQWELRVKTSKLPKARENAGDQVLIVFIFFASNWLRGCHEFSGPITGRSKAKPLQFDIDSWKLLYRLLQIRTLEVTVLLQCFSARLFSVNFFHSRIQPCFTRLLWWTICPSISSLCLRATLSASCQS